MPKQSASLQTNSVPRPHSNPAGTTISADKVPKDVARNSVMSSMSSKSSNDLLGLGLDFESTPTASETGQKVSTPAVDEDPFDAFVSATKSTNPSTAPLSLADEESDFFNQKVPDKKMDRDSILKMFDASSNYMTMTPAAPFAANNPMAGLNNNTPFFAPVSNAINANTLLQNGSGHTLPNQVSDIHHFEFSESIPKLNKPNNTHDNLCCIAGLLKSGNKSVFSFRGKYSKCTSRLIPGHADTEFGLSGTHQQLDEQWTCPTGLCLRPDQSLQCIFWSATRFSFPFC